MDRADVEKVKGSIDIVSVISGYVSLKKRGRTYVGLCPFHTEKTPSFHVDSARQTYKCFGCGKGGDAFSFLMEIKGVSFPEALQELARQAGARHLVLRGDSDFAVRHLRGEAVTQVARLKVLIAAIRAQLDGFASARLEWVPRHRNPDADRLSRAALGLPDKPAEWPGIKRRRKRP